MKKSYRWKMTGLAAKGQTWETEGFITIDLADFPDLLNTIMEDNFDQLTQGKAVYGFPGVGCQGPYDIKSINITQEIPQ